MMNPNAEQVKKPNVTVEDVKRLLENLYGIKCTGVEELNAYVDRNYLISDGNTRFVLKILTASQSKQVDYIEAQNSLLNHLIQQDFLVPKVVKTMHGQGHVTEVIGGASHNVRLFEFIPGTIMTDVQPTEALHFQVGEHLARMHEAMQTFSHPGLTDRKSVWMLENVAQIQPYFFAVQDDQKLKVVEEVLEKFAELVTPMTDRLTRGPIHSDMNDYNILVNDEPRLIGVLDFGDICYSCHVFDLAVAMTYMMWQREDLNAGGIVLAGYNSIRPVVPEELQILKVCVAARLCQSLVLSSYTHSMDPDNEYVLTDLKGAWELLYLVWSHDDELLLGFWESVGHVHTKDNLKKCYVVC